ncbi:MAG: 3-hydroxyacyl-ACP dehydratase FabZ family protein [Planctomycetota bacterium]|jgi:3-hydroxyacyl-[acyl-carrier-protein] dehydratase
MPPATFVDLAELDLDEIEFDREAIRQRNPHRYEFELLHGIHAFRPDDGIIVGYHQASEDEFWVLCSFYWREAFPEIDRFFGFAGIENTRFRGVVEPGDRLILVGKMVQVKPRRAIFDAQGFVDDSMVFETRIKGMPV